MKNEALGVDIGNVIIDCRSITNTEDETLWNEKFSNVPPAEGVFECLKKLNEEKFHGAIFLVSKLKEEQDDRTLKWLKDNKFFEKTGIKPENLILCRDRSEKEKICRERNVTHFIDDRLEVLSYMVDKVPNLYLFQPDPAEVEEFKQFLPKVTLVKNWMELFNLIK